MKRGGDTLFQTSDEDIVTSLRSKLSQWRDLGGDPKEVKKELRELRGCF